MQRLDQEIIFGARGLSQLTGFARGTVYNKVHRGEIPHRKLGHRLIFIKSEVLRYLDELPGLRAEDMGEIDR